MLFYLLSGCCFLIALIIFVIRRGNRNVKVEGDSRGIIITGDNANDVKQVNAPLPPAKPVSPSPWQWIERVLTVTGAVIAVLAYFFPRIG